MAITLNGTTGITAPDISVTAQSTDITTTGDITAVDATLSGGVYLGGTVAANYLDDYEEGTWNPTITGLGSAGTVSYANRVGHYTKVGNLVTLIIHLNWNSGSGGSGQLAITGLPFTAENANNYASSGFYFDQVARTSGSYPQCYIEYNTTRIVFSENSGTSAGVISWDAAGVIVGSITYRSA